MLPKTISVEGQDGCGKSTQARVIEEILAAHGIPYIQVREPGGTPLGERLRALLLNEEMTLETEALLMFASRQELLTTRVRPALANGLWVILDRFSDSTYAYQCGGRGLDPAKFQALVSWTHPDFEPDLTLYYDVPPDVGANRVAATGAPLDRFEQESTSFFERVRGAYLARASQAQDRILVVDSAKELAQVSQATTTAVEALIRAAAGVR